MPLAMSAPVFVPMFYVTVGGFVAFIGAMLMLIQPLRRLTDVVGPITRGLTALERGLDLMNEVLPEADAADFDLAGALLGTFAMYYREPRGPVAREVAWVGAATHLAAVAIAHDRSERSLRQSEAKAQHLARLYAVSSSINEATVRVRDRQEILDAACQLGHYAIFLVLPIVIWGPIAFAIYAATWAIVGVMLALIFAPAHIGLPIIVDQNCDWEHQLETTRNLALPRWLSWFFVGLDYQVEHHLFPKIAHQELPRATAPSPAPTCGSAR